MKVSDVISCIKNDITDRSKWESRDEKVIKRRMGWRPTTKTFPYKGAPNFVEPVIDDVARDRVEQEISMLLNAPHVCHVSPLQSMDPSVRMSIEVSFDSYIRYVIKARSRLEEALDTKNVRGFSVAKQVRRYNELLGQSIPDFEVCDLLDIVVPTDCKDMESAERICHIIRYTEREFRERARVKGWKFDDEKLKSVLSKDNGTTNTNSAGNSQNNTHDKTLDIVGVTTSRDTKYVVVWEVYRYADDDDAVSNPNTGIVTGKRIIQWVLPDDSTSPLATLAWKEADTYEVVNTNTPMGPIEQTRTVVGKDRSWPFVQFRFENRSSYWYDVRGIGILCMDDQISATQLRNSQAVRIDYSSSPLFLNEGMDNPGNITFEPGSVLPKGIKRETPPQMDTSLELMINSHRSQAGRRVGAGGVYNYSTEAGISRKIQKTATEISSDENKSVGMSSSSVDRFNEPLATLFNMIFKDMQRMKLVFPVILPGTDRPISMDMSSVQGPVLLLPASSSKTLNPDTQISRSMALSDWLKGYAEALPVNVRAMVSTVLSNYDSRLTQGWLLPENDEEVTDINLRLQTVEKSIDNLVQGSQQLAEYVKKLGMMLDKVVNGSEKVGAPQ